MIDRRTVYRPRATPRSRPTEPYVVQIPFQALNANAYAERFVRSIKHECPDRVIPFGEHHLQRTMSTFVEHYKSTTQHP